MSKRNWRNGSSLLLLAVSGLAAGQAMLDQQQPVIANAGYVLAIGGASEQKLAQVVTAGITGNLLEVRLPAACGAPGPGMTLQIQQVTAGVPNGVVLTSQEVAASPLPVAVGMHSMPLSTPVFMTAGTKFAIVLIGIGACATNVGPSGDSYAGGNGYFDARPNPPGWVCMCEFAGTPFDLPFQTFVQPAAPPLPTMVPTLSELGLATMVVALALIALGALRRRPIGMP